MSNTRKITNKLLEMVEEGVLDPQALAEACLLYMSESDVADMAHINELIFEEEDEEDQSRKNTVKYFLPTM